MDVIYLWIRRIIGLGAFGISLGILFALFMPISALFFIIAVGLLIFGFTWFFC